MESMIMRVLNFDFRFLDPMIFLDRFLRLSNLHKNTKVISIAREICQRAAAKSSFLEFRPSEIAASSLLMAVNLLDTPKN